MVLVAVDWDIEKYHIKCIREQISDGMQPKELRIAMQFPPVAAELRSIAHPTTVSDKYGRIILWALPNILPKRCQVRRR